MHDPGHQADRINAVGTAFTIVDALREAGQAGVSSLADRLEMPKSTVHVHLKTLEDEGYVVNDDGSYRLSFRFLEIGGELRQAQTIYQAARTELDKLSAETGEVTNLGIEDRGKRVLLYTSEPAEGMFDNSPTGQYTHMHWTALGKTLLSQLPDDRVEEIANEQGLPQGTENTITDPEALSEELATIRERGYAVEAEERREGIKAIAVPVRHGRGEVSPAAVSISGPRRRIDGDGRREELLAALKDAANVIELEYKHY